MTTETVEPTNPNRKWLIGGIVGVVLLAILLCVGVTLWVMNQGGSVTTSISQLASSDQEVSREEAISWEEPPPQDGYVVVGDPTTENMEVWLAQNFNVNMVGYKNGGVLFSEMSHLSSGDLVSFHLVENHRDLPQELFTDYACFGTIIQYNPEVHGSYALPSAGNVVVWNDPGQIEGAIKVWNNWRETTNTGWTCAYPKLFSE